MNTLSLSIKAVCVYCGARREVPDIYLNEAYDLGAMLAGQGITTVYGGGSTGLMGALADGALQADGKVIGVVPENIDKLEALHDSVDLRKVATMHARKLMMFDLSDAVIVLPGGIGTLDEFFEVLTWKQLGIHAKPIYLLNTGGYWDDLIHLIDQLIGRGFTGREVLESFVVINSRNELISSFSSTHTP